jgi:hypothetical protein
MRIPLFSFLFFLIASFSAVAQTANESGEIKGTVIAKSRQDILKQLPVHVAYLNDQFEPVTLLYKNGSRIEAVMNICLVDNSLRLINAAGDTLLMSNAKEVERIIADSALFVQINDRFYRQMMVYGAISLSEEKHFEFKEPEISTGYGSAPKTSTAVQMSTREYNHSRAYDYETEIPYTLKYKYVLVKGEKVYAAKESNFTKLFPEKKKAIKKFVDDHDINFRNKQDLLSLFYFCTQE